MSYPQQPGNWNDPSWPNQPPATDPSSPYGAPASVPPPYGDPAAAAAAAQQASPAGYPGSEYVAPGYAGYPGYGYQPVPATNGLAIAAMVISIVGALGLCGYGLGGYIGIVGAIMGHVARRQIRERGENGDGMAMAGIIVGWIVAAIAIIATILIVVFIVWAANQPTA